MKTYASHLAIALVTSITLAAGCATSTASGPASAPSDVAGSKWKLPVVQGRRDGRKIEFKARGSNRYDVLLTNVGFQLDKIPGAHEGLVLMELETDGSPRMLRGIERIPGRDLAEVRCTISAKADEMKCNNEEWVWLRDS